MPRRLATNLAELDIVYRDGWSVDRSTKVERFVSRGDGGLVGSEPAFGLVVPEGREEPAATEAPHFSAVPVRLTSGPGLEEATIVRPDGYVASHGSPDDPQLLLGPLARTLEN